MSAIQQLHEVTNNFYDFLCDSNIKREDIVKKIDEFIDEQGSLLNKLPNPAQCTEEEKKLLNGVVILKPKIEKKLNEIQSGIKKDIARVKNTKKFSQQKPPAQADGTFFDKKQ